MNYKPSTNNCLSKETNLRSNLMPGSMIVGTVIKKEWSYFHFKEMNAISNMPSFRSSVNVTCIYFVCECCINKKF